MDDMMNAMVGQCEKELCPIEDTILGSLNRRKLRLESQLKDVNAALDALNANPKVAELLELVQKARR